MKKRIGILFLLSFLAVGCHGGNTSNTSETTSNGQTSDIEFNKLYTSSSWDDVVPLISVIAGENAESVPSVGADTFEYYLSVDSQSSIDIAVVKCYGFNENVVVNRYESALLNNGFQLSSENPYGWMEVSVTEDLVVQYEIYTDSKNQNYFELLIYKVELRMAEWPKAAIEEVTCEEVPEVKGQSYEAFADFTIDYKARVIVYTYHPEIKNVQEYEKQLIDAGYTINASQYYSEAVSKLGTHIMYSYSSEEDIFAVYIYNDWPYFDINYYLGMDLPRLDYEGAEMSYSYIVYDEATNYQILGIYYDYVDISVLETYGSALEEVGFEQYGDEWKTSGQYHTTNREYVINIDKADEHDIVLSYCEELQSLVIVIYY